MRATPHSIDEITWACKASGSLRPSLSAEGFVIIPVKTVEILGMQGPSNQNKQMLVVHAGFHDQNGAAGQAEAAAVVPHQVPALHHGGQGALREWAPLLPPCVHCAGKGRLGRGCQLHGQAAGGAPPPV